MHKTLQKRHAKLFCGLIGHSFDSAIEKLEEKFGKIDTSSDVVQFDYTNYYNDEMGENLLRKWLSFEELVDEDDIGQIKRITCSIEKDFTRDEKRTVNIDPGYVNLSKVVLASTKDYSHRIYIGGDIFVEVTLIYIHGRFTPLPWTYPDYADNVKYFEKVRNTLYTQMHDNDS